MIEASTVIYWSTQIDTFAGFILQPCCQNANELLQAPFQAVKWQSGEGAGKTISWVNLAQKSTDYLCFKKLKTMCVLLAAWKIDHSFIKQSILDSKTLFWTIWPDKKSIYDIYKNSNTQRSFVITCSSRDKCIEITQMDLKF